MRVAVFIKGTTLHNNYGGIETQNKVLCEGLTRRGHSVIVFSPKKNLTKENTVLNGVEYVFVECKYRLGFLLGFGGSYDKNNWVNRSFTEFCLHHETKKFDLILSQSSAGVGIISKKQILNVKVLSVAHGTIASEYKTYVRGMNFFSPKELYTLVKNTGYFLLNFFTRQRHYVHGSDKLIAVSGYVKKELINETYVEESKVYIVNNGIEPFETNNSKENSPQERFCVIYAGRLEKSKGVHILIDALKEKLGLRIHLILIGDGPFSQKLKQQVHELNLGDFVTFVGKISHDEVLQLLWSADVFVLPSLRIEGFPMTLVEAMFAELPIIASDIGGISDAIEDGVTGFLIKPGDVEVLKEKIHVLEEDKSLRESLGVAGAEKAKKEFSLNVMLDSYEKVMRKILE